MSAKQEEPKDGSQGTLDAYMPEPGRRWMRTLVIVCLGFIGIAVWGAAKHVADQMPLKEEQRAVLEGLIGRSAAARQVDDATVVGDLTRYMNGIEPDRLTRGDFKRAREWLAGQVRSQ